MARPSELDKQWQELMSLCAMEKEFYTDRPHPKLVKLLSKQIDELAAAMGFSHGQIQTREFRAVRDGARIIRAITE
jgi:fructose/tagatose bisphosphate aldolase